MLADAAYCQQRAVALSICSGLVPFHSPQIDSALRVTTRSTHLLFNVRNRHQVEIEKIGIFERQLQLIKHG